jgi:hypothetical protein
MHHRPPVILDAVRRPLAAAERRALRARMQRLRSTGRRAATIALPVAAGGTVLLWLLTLLASDAPWTVVTGFWVLVGGAIAVWVRRDMRADAAALEGSADALASALRRNAADVFDVDAAAFVELEEIEDEGACYALQLDGDRVVFVTGQEFYPAARFPSRAFSLVYVLDEADRRVDMLIDKRGPREAPVRTIPAAVKRTLEVPEHLEVRRGRLETLEAILGASAGPVRPRG